MGVVVIGLLALALPMTGRAAPAPFQPGDRDLKVRNTNDTVKLTVQTGGGQTTNLVEAYAGSTLKFAVPATGILPAAYGGTGSATNRLQVGSNATTSNGTVTNTFPAAFTVAPYVVCQKINSNAGTNTVVSVTTTNFIYTAGAPSITFHWIAVGAP